jgi:hypothetical protein
MSSEGALTMAKKKTAEPATAAPRATQPRRRSARQAAPPEPMPAPATTAAPVPAMKDPTFEEIAEAAYQRYLRRGGQHGQDFDDWVEAERVLRTRK